MVWRGVWHGIRRVVMWAALVVAVGIGVVWAGGERTWFFWSAIYWKGQAPEEQFLFVKGLLGGFSIEWRPWSYMIVEGSYVPDVNTIWWMWLPRLNAWAWSHWVLRIPYWIPTLLCLMTFGLLFRIERREKRFARAGRCGACGYDLVGLAAGVVCPECGGGVESRKTLT